MCYFWRSISPSPLGQPGENPNVRFAHELDLVDFLNSDDPILVNYIDNLYVRRLTGTYVSGSAADEMALYPAETLAAALRALDGIESVGVTEELAKFGATLSKTWDLDDVPLPRMNDAAANGSDRPQEFRAVAREPVTPAIEAALDRLTRLDSVIYQTACERLARDAQPTGHHRT